MRLSVDHRPSSVVRRLKEAGSKMLTRYFLVIGILSAVMMLIVCGEDEISRSPQEGKILLKNNTDGRMKATYLVEKDERVDVIVEPGETRDISQTSLAGGTKTVVEVNALEGTRPQAEIPVTIDGDVTIEIVSFGHWGTDELEYRVQWGREATRGGSGGKKFKDGRIFLWNETTVPMDVSYFTEELGQIDTRVQPGEEVDVSKAVLEGGMEVTMVVRAVTVTRPTAEISITVDGRRLIRVTSLGAWGSGDLQYIIQ